MDDAMRSSRRGSCGACPHVNRNDLRCGTRFRLDRLDQAFRVCFGSYHACPMYHRINAEQDAFSAQAEPAAAAAVVRVTVAGHGVNHNNTTHAGQSGAQRPLRVAGA